MGLSVDCGTGMELAFTPDSDDWTQHLNFTDYIDEIGILKPVTWSEDEKCFYSADFGHDGRIKGITERLSDSANTNSKKSNGYYLKYTCYARTGEPVKVSLTPAVVGADGTQGAGTYVIGTPLWDGENILHNNGGNGAEYSIRVGLNIVMFDSETKERKDESVFYVYEPNCDMHIDGSQGITDTASINGTATLVPEDRLIQQTTSTWTEADPVQRGVIIRDLGDFVSDTYLFELGVDEFAKIDVYVWLEGQDTDCTNEIGDEAQIFVNLQFDAQAKTNSGLEIIE